jgi:hypothetical protein
MNGLPVLFPVFIQHEAALKILTGGDQDCVFRRLIALLKQNSCIRVIVATDRMSIAKIARSEGVETLNIPAPTGSNSGQLLRGWQEAGRAYFSKRDSAYLLMADFAHPFAYDAAIHRQAEAWIRSRHAVAFCLEAVKDHPCQVEICYPKRIEAIVYQPFTMKEPIKKEIPECVFEKSAWRPDGVDECWAILIVDGVARSDRLITMKLPGETAAGGNRVCRSIGQTRDCILLWLRQTQPDDDPLIVPMEMLPRLWKVCPDGVRNLVEADLPITGRQMFPEVMQLSSAAIMIKKGSWTELPSFLETDNFHPLIVKRSPLSDPQLDAAIGLLELIERS